MNSESGDIFRALTPQERAAIERQVALRVYPANHVFFRPGEQGEALFLLREGRVRLYKLSPEGRALTLAILEPTTIFGEMIFAMGSVHDAFAEALSECIVGAISRMQLQSIVAGYPSVAFALMETMGQRMHGLENKLADIAFKSVPARLATLLLNLAADGDGLRPIRYTHLQIAEMIGAYRETVTKALGDLREIGLIRIEEGAIHLADPSGLARLANS